MFAMHDPWIDEAQGWLVAKSLSRSLDFLVIPSEGHPPLWFWLLRALSLVLDFSQARLLMPIVALVNAWLLSRLFRSDVVLLTLVLFSFVVLQFWGYHFRPYGLVFTAMLSALLLDRNGRPIAATWCLAIACGFHFFAGFLFAFFLIWQWRKGTKLSHLIPPAVLAAAFGVSAVLSGLGNSAVDQPVDNVIAGTLGNLGWLGMFAALRVPLTAFVTLALLVYGFWAKPGVLAALLALLVTFAVATSRVYDLYPWHFAFMTMLCLMAYVWAGPKARRWVMLAILAPQTVVGAWAIVERLSHPVWLQPNLYAVVSADAGPDFRPEAQLVAWPDLVGLATAADEDIQFISGNTGETLGPINWRTWKARTIDKRVLEVRRPYWLLCTDCEVILDLLEENGMQGTFLAAKSNIDNGEMEAWRIE
ncbi:hypothetical protein ASD80_04645 [Devosia sp. Root635]|nr:hypothetical protein ASD80_04645 [Devosia sp. Root635]